MLTLAAVLAFTLPAQAINPNVLHVTGDAEVQVAPDLVTISVGVITRHAQLATAKSQNDAALRAVMSAASRNGVPAGDIQSDFIEIQPAYDAQRTTHVLHYEIHKAVTVTLREVRRFDALLTAMVDAGANQVYGVEFQTTALRKHRDTARANAMKAALEKAQALAGAAGLRVGKPSAVTSYNVGSYSRYGRWRRYDGGQMASQQVSYAGNEPANAGMFAPGRISIRADVALTFPMQP